MGVGNGMRAGEGNRKCCCSFRCVLGGGAGEKGRGPIKWGGKVEGCNMWMWVTSCTWTERGMGSADRGDGA